MAQKHDQAEVGVHHSLLRLRVALLDALGQLHLLVSGQERIAPDLVEKQPRRVRRRIGEASRRHDRRGRLPAAVVPHVHALIGQAIPQPGDGLVVKFESVHRLGEGRKLDAAAAPSPALEPRLGAPHSLC